MALLNKRKTTEHVELPDGWIALMSKSHSNRTYYYNKITKQSTWQNPMENIQKDKNSVKTPHIGKSSGSSRKRKSTGDTDTSEPPTIVLDADKLSTTRLNREHDTGDKITSIARTKSTRICSSALDKKNFQSENTLQNTKNTHDLTPDKKWNLRSTSDKSSTGKETEKQCSVASKRKKVKSCRGLEEKQKTSAQSRLIEKRKQFEIEAKKALCAGLDKASNLLMEIEKEESDRIVSSLSRKSTQSRSSSPQFCVKTKRINFRDVMRKHSRESKEKDVDFIFDRDVIGVSDKSYISDEEMDWEPSEQEIMIEHIKTIRKNHGNFEEPPGDITVFTLNDLGTDYNKSSLILVFDTNVFISCLPFIKEVRDTCVPGLGLPIIFIPWRVLQELDHLKTSGIPPLQVSAIRAVRFLNENFSSHHPRISGQSYEEFKSTPKSSDSCPDDDILEICLNMKQKDQSKIVILITNDKNLETKAIVSGIEAFSKDGFVKKKLTDSNQRISGVNSGSKSSSARVKSDLIYCRLKGALKKCLEQLLESEFENAFNNDWRKVVTKKPPWMLIDMFDCFVKYWRSVFTLIFNKDVLTLVKDLKEYFIKVDKGEDVVIADIAQVSKEMLTKMMNCGGDKKPYSKALSDTISNIEIWIEPKKSSNTENAVESQSTVPLPQVSSLSEEQQNICSPQSSAFDISLCKEKIKNLFHIIWDQVKSFSVTELAASNGMISQCVVDEVKHQFPHVVRNVQELIEIIEKILSLDPEDSFQANQILLYFTNFLVGLNVFQIDPTELNKLPGYIGLFCSDIDGRVILCTFVNDLKQFAMGMIDGMKVLERLH